MRKFIAPALLLITLTLPAAAGAQHIDTIFKEGNTAYWDDNFDKALERYHHLWNALKYRSPEVAYNLGLTWFKKGDPGKAVYFMKTALRLTPSGDLKERILRAVTRIKTSIVDAAGKDIGVYQLIYADPDSMWTRWLVALSPVLQVALTAVVAMLFLLLFILARRRPGVSIRIATGLAAVALLLMVFTCFSSIEHHRVTRTGILLSPKVIVKEALTPHAPAYSVPGGVEVKLLGATAGHIKVKLPTGSLGYVGVDEVGELK